MSDDLAHRSAYDVFRVHRQIACDHHASFWAQRAAQIGEHRTQAIRRIEHDPGVAFVAQFGERRAAQFFLRRKKTDKAKCSSAMPLETSAASNADAPGTALTEMFSAIACRTKRPPGSARSGVP